jgi:hypothetical protein
MMTVVVVATYTGLNSDRQFHTVKSFGLSTTDGHNLLAIKNQHCHIPHTQIVLDSHVGGGDAAA